MEQADHKEINVLPATMIELGVVVMGIVILRVKK